MNLTLYHNPRCSTSRKVLDLLTENGASITVRHYLQEPLTAVEITALAAITEGGMAQLLRSKEPLYQELIAHKTLSGAELAAILAAHPILLNRPIVSTGSRAIAARPPENALTLLED